MGLETDRTDLQSAGANVSVSQGILNDTLRDLLNRYPFTWRVTPTPVTVSANLGGGVTGKLYNITAVAPKVMDIYGIILDDGTLSTRLMDEISLNDYIQKWGNIDFLPTGRPVEYTKASETKFLVAPIPQDPTYNFRCYISYQFAEITDFTLAITDVPDRALETLRVGMLCRLYRWLHEWEIAAKLYNLYEQLIKVLIDEDKTAPNLEFRFQEAVFAVRPVGINYWQSPFMKGM